MVISRTEAALAGSAVADLIHLIAELAENATIFSPPNTPVRILGDTVGKGLAVEIEDRGLGISDEPLADINRDLADPPQFDLSGSDRLGLFVAARLAARHDIKISLRPSVHGGTTAIVLIPLPLVTQPEPADSGLPGSAGRELPPRLARRRSALSSGCARVPLRHCRGRRQLPGRSGGGRGRCGPDRLRDGRARQAGRRAPDGQDAAGTVVRRGAVTAMNSPDDHWLDADAGPVVRPYALTGGAPGRAARPSTWSP